jgi:hypothetical protein
MIIVTMHELKQFIDNSFEELPVGPEESGILPHHVHDVGGNDSFVVLALFLLAKTQQIFDDGHQKPFFVLLVHGSGNAAYCPAQLQKINNNN